MLAQEWAPWPKVLLVQDSLVLSRWTSVDINSKMVGLCAKTACGECIQGDIGDGATLVEIWKHARYSNTMSAGSNCQPFSKLGDGRSGLDPRAASLRNVLRAAYLLQIPLLTLEFVQPAASDEYVKDA